MPAPFPLIKLAALLVKQISKPIANAAKERAKTHPFFRTYVCMPPAQLYNWCEIKLKMWVMNLGKPVNIPVLSEAMAIELGASLLGESIVFTIATGVLIAEYTRSSKKETAKEAARKEEFDNLTYQLQELYFRVEQQDTQIRELNRSLVDLSSKKSKIGSFLNIGSKSTTEDETEEPISKAPPAGTIVIPISNENFSLGNNNIQTLEYSPNYGVVQNAVRMVEYELLGDGNYPRENGFLTNALHYIERDIFKTSVVI